ncbi:MAG: hypothetical protein V3W14_03020 [Candidatus Neomarinimicrobiota bacterium]
MTSTNSSSTILTVTRIPGAGLGAPRKIAGRSIWLVIIALACGLTAQEPADSAAAPAGESLLEEVFEHRISLLQDTLFLRQEQLDATNFTARQLEQSVAGLTDTLTQVRAELQVTSDSLTRMGVQYDRVTDENRQHLTQLSALSDSLAVTFNRAQALQLRHDSLKTLSDSILVQLDQAQADLVIADSMERAITDTVVALKLMLEGLEGQVSANEEGLSGMYEQLKMAMIAADEEMLDSTTDAQYLAHLHAVADYKMRTAGMARLFGGGDDEELAIFKLDEFRQYFRWSGLRGRSPEAMNLLAATYYEQGDQIRGALTYLKTVFLFPETEAGLHARGQLEEKFTQNDEIGRLYYEVALNPDSMQVGDDDFYRYLHFLDYIRTLQNVESRRYFIDETQHFLALFPGIFRGDELQLWVAQTYHALEEFHKEILSYTKIRNIYPDSELIPEITYALAEVTAQNLESDDLGAARYAQFREQFPEHELAPAALMAEALLYETELKRATLAGDLYRHLADTYSEDVLAPVALFRFAELFRTKLGSPAGALATYEEILSSYGEEQSIGIPALQGLASISKETRQYDAAVTYHLDIYQRYPDADESAVAGILEAAKIYESNLKNLDAAIHTLHLVLDNYPEYQRIKRVQKQVQKLQKKKG